MKWFSWFRRNIFTDSIHVRHAKICEVCYVYEKTLKDIRDGRDFPAALADATLKWAETQEGYDNEAG